MEISQRRENYKNNRNDENMDENLTIETKKIGSRN